MTPDELKVVEQARDALRDHRDWYKHEYQSNEHIDKRADDSIAALSRLLDAAQAPAPRPRTMRKICDECGNPFDERFHSPLTGRCI